MSTILRLFCNNFAQLLIGGAMLVMVSYFVTAGPIDVHAALCIFGYNFISVQAILWLNYWNGYSKPQIHRCVHMCMQIIGMSCAIAGSLVAFISYGINSESGVHDICGIVAMILSLITSLMGLSALKAGYEVTLAHVSLGMASFIAYTLTFVFGLFLPSFKNWADPKIFIMLIAIICLYTAIIFISTCWRFIVNIGF